MKRARIGIVGDYDPTYISHDATGASLDASGLRLGMEVEWQWVATEAVAANGVVTLDRFGGIWAAPGSPYRSLDGALAAIRFARERGVPFLGT